MFRFHVSIVNSLFYLSLHLAENTPCLNYTLQSWLNVIIVYVDLHMNRLLVLFDFIRTGKVFY